MQRQPRIPEWHISETRGKPFAAYGRQIIPVGRVVQISWPGGGFTWHRPVAVEVHQGDKIRRLPIYNATRRATAMVMLVGLAIVVLVSAWRRGGSIRRRITS